jgi:GNAT superfamily N-acetyltransferase
MLIRKAILSDEAALFELVRAFPTPTPIPRDAYSKMYAQKLNDSSSFIAVASNESALVGYVSGHYHSAFYASGCSAWIDEIFVLNTERRYGTGRMLVSAFESWAAESGCKLVALATAGASDFYLRLGYSTKASYFKKYLL